MFEHIDKKRVFVALIVLLVILGAGFLWAKENVPKFTGKFFEKESAETGEVISAKDPYAEFAQQRQELESLIGELKEEIAKLKPEDVKEQEQVKKILKDLETLKEKATESAKVFDARGNLCEEAKRRFCE